MSTRPSHSYYRVEYDGDLIVEGSRDPEHDLARALLARGLTGKITMLDANTGKPRTTVDIERAAKVTVEENERRGPRFVKWKPMPGNAHQRSEGSPHTAEDDLALLSHTPGGKRGCMSHSHSGPSANSG